MPRLLIIDEIDYLPIDQASANQNFGTWSEVYGDRINATATLDRVLHHAITINIRGNSYRLKDKLKAGLIRTVELAVN